MTKEATAPATGADAPENSPEKKKKRTKKAKKEYRVTYEPKKRARFGVGPAFFVWLDVPGVRGEFDDNSFTLLPGEPRTVAFAPADGATDALPEVTVSALG